MPPPVKTSVKSTYLYIVTVYREVKSKKFHFDARLQKTVYEILDSSFLFLQRDPGRAKNVKTIFLLWKLVHIESEKFETTLS